MPSLIGPMMSSQPMKSSSVCGLNSTERFLSITNLFHDKYHKKMAQEMYMIHRPIVVHPHRTTDILLSLGLRFCYFLLEFPFLSLDNTPSQNLGRPLVKYRHECRQMVLRKDSIACFTATSEVIHSSTETTFGEDNGRPLLIRWGDTMTPKFQ